VIGDEGAREEHDGAASDEHAHALRERPQVVRTRVVDTGNGEAREH
jgi:hypothetical protein